MLVFALVFLRLTEEARARFTAPRRSSWTDPDYSLDFPLLFPRWSRQFLRITQFFCSHRYVYLLPFGCFGTQIFQDFRTVEKIPHYPSAGNTTSR